jgi:rhodanese-related sulfurtransferase
VDIKIKCATVQEAFTALSADTSSVLIDVREDAEIREIAATIGKKMPMSSIDPGEFASACGVHKEQPIYLLCRSGGRSMKVAQALAEVGFSNLTNITGGIIAWNAANLPVKKG